MRFSLLPCLLLTSVAVVCTPIPLTLSIDNIAEPQASYENKHKFSSPLPSAWRTDATPEVQPRNFDGSWATCDGQFKVFYTNYIIRGKGWGDKNNAMRLKFEIAKTAGGWGWEFQRIEDGAWQLTFSTMIVTESRVEHAIKKLYGIRVECT